MKNITIMQIIYSLDVGGMENVLVDIVNNFKSSFINPRFIICCIAKSGNTAKKIRKGNVKIISINKKVGNDFLLPLKLTRIMTRENVKLVHTHGWGAYYDGVISAIMAGKIPIIHTVHGKFFENLACEKIRRIYLQRLLSLQTDKIVTVSKDLQTYYSRLLHNSRKIYCIYNGVDINKFNTSKNKDQVKRKLGLNPDDLVVGTVGRLDPIKDHETILKSASLVLKDLPNTKFLIIGDGLLKKNLEELAFKLKINNDVIFLGERNDIPELLNVMDIFILSSLFEGNSKTLLEAMATGLPIIATNVGGNRELIEDRKTGILIPPSDKNYMADILKLINRDYKAYQFLGIQAREKVEKDFSIENMIFKYSKLYEEIITKKK